MPDDTGGRTGDNEAHEHVELEGRVLRLTHELEHHAYPTIATWVEKHNRYAVWEAAMYDRFLKEPIPATHRHGASGSSVAQEDLPAAALAPAGSLHLCLRLPPGFLDGKPGLVFCTLLSFYDFLAWANVYERRVADGPRLRLEYG